MSQALVSLVLNGRRDGIKPATYERIWQHTALCGYRAKGMSPSAAAATRPPQIGIILDTSLSFPRLGNYFSHVQHGLHNAVAKSGGSTVFLGAESDLTDNRLSSYFSTGHCLHGLALFGEASPPFLENLAKLQPRIVSIGARTPAFGHTVNADETQSLTLLVRHLHELGHRRIGWLGGKAGLARHQTRHTAFHAALASVGLAPDSRYEITRAQADRAEGAEAIHTLLPLARRSDFPTAFICYNSLMAIGATLALNHAGWETPARVSIVGADIPRPVTHGELAVTGAGTCPELLGQSAARVLLDSTFATSLRHQHFSLPAHLSIGETSGPAPDSTRTRRTAAVAST